jgi:dolichyl-phosphate-mannose-protein mannosyltransferase
VSDWVGTALMCVATTAAGWPWAAYLTNQRPPVVARAALAWLAGAALATLAMLIIVYPGLPLNRATLVVAFVGTFALGWALNRRGQHRHPTALFPGSMWVAAVPAAVAMAALAYGTALAFRLGPVDSTDFAAIWGLKGAFAFEEHSLAFSGHAGSHLFYPLLVSNMNAVVFIALGHVNDTVVRLPGAMFGLAVAGAMWWLLRLRVTPVWAALAVCLAVTTPEFTIAMTSGLADLTVAAYLTVALLAAYLWATSPGSDWAALSGFMAGGAAWSKLEGAPTAIVLFVAVMVIRRRVRVPGAEPWLLWMAVFVIPWQVYMRIHGIPVNREHFAQLYLNVWWITDHVARTLLETSHWGFFWPVCIAIVALAAPIWWASDWRALGILVIPNLILTAGAYLTQNRSGTSGSVEGTAHRLYLHLAPAAAALAAAAALTASDRLAPWLKRAPYLHHTPRR